MNKLLLAAALLMTAQSLHADHLRQAQLAGDFPVFYVLGGVGQAALQKTSAEPKGVSFQAGGGFVLSKNWAIETTYTDFGGAESGANNADLTGITLGFLGLVNTGKSTAVFGRVDAVSVKLDDQKGKISPSVGFGIQHGFTHGYAARLQYQHTFYSNKNANADKVQIGLISVQAIKSF